MKRGDVRVDCARWATIGILLIAVSILTGSNWALIVCQIAAGVTTGIFFGLLFAWICRKEEIRELGDIDPSCPPPFALVSALFVGRGERPGRVGVIVGVAIFVALFAGAFGYGKVLTGYWAGWPFFAPAIAASIVVAFLGPPTVILRWMGIRTKKTGEGAL